jgi:dTDP-4-dehydrorhamnose reductase
LTQGRGTNSDLSLDPSDHSAVAKALAVNKPTAVLNLIAATDVDKCEAQPELAWLANASVVSAIAKSLATSSTRSDVRPHLIHLSTDHVYDGLGPHSEEDVHPINVYGLSKFTGELLADKVGATVLRSNFFGRSRCPSRRSFSDWLVESLREGKPIMVFDDVKFSAVHMDTLCSIIVRSVELRPAGTFNVGCRDSMSKAGFALALAQALGVVSHNIKIGSISTSSLKARRPLDMSMQVTKLESALGLECPKMLDEIVHTSKEYLND